MAILIFNKYSADKAPYKDWFFGQELFIVTSQEVSLTYNNMANIHVFSFANYDDNGNIDHFTYNLLKDKKINLIISSSEPDILRTAKLREKFNIQGQSYKSALAYRNKFVMKEYLLDAHIPIAPHRILDEYIDLFEFIDLYNYPVVVKPIAGSGGVNTFVLKNSDELKELIKKDIVEYREHTAKYLVEKFVKGNMYHIDGIAIDNKIVFYQVSCYIESCLSFQESTAVGSYTIDPQSTLSSRLHSLTALAISALPSPDRFVFHAEIFYNECDDELVFCEIASRVGGSIIDKTVEVATGINLTKNSILLQDPLFKFDIPEYKYQPSGFMLIPPQAGTLIAIPTSINNPEVSTYSIAGKIGNTYLSASKTVDRILDYVVTAESEQQVKNSLLDIENQLNREILWKI